jgi:uncharacterized protein YbaR (Trm112 family)
MHTSLPTTAELKDYYARGVNIMALLRACTGSENNRLEAILAAYDLQAGTYIRALDDPGHRERFAAYSGEIAEILASLGGRSLLEAGVGEATTLCAVAPRLHPGRCAGFDIAWSRLAHGRRYAGQRGLRADLFLGDLFRIPLPEGAFDVVYTAHSIEPNHGNEREALLELHRITRRWLALFEPSYELGNDGTRARIEEHGYCRGLPALAQELGMKVVRHQLLRSPMRPNNQTALLLIEKDSRSEPAEGFACPACHTALHSRPGAHFCDRCSLIYPVIADIPCLLPENAILGSQFLDFSPD